MGILLILGLVGGTTILLGLLFVPHHSFALRRFLSHRLQPGVPIVYRMLETSSCPSRDASEIYPAPRGELYTCLTKKYWRVEEVRPDGWIIARTPLMEQEFLRNDDPNLRRANILERLRYATRFPCPTW